MKKTLNIPNLNFTLSQFFLLLHSLIYSIFTLNYKGSEKAIGFTII